MYNRHCQKAKKIKQRRHVPGNKPLTHFSLFSGIGGIDLAAEWAGFQTVAQCDNAEFPTKILTKHWPDVPKWKDIRNVTRETFKAKTGQDTVTLITGGFPCQPFSQAGKRRGSADDRYLWPEMFRVIEELRSDWVIGENVAGFINMALDTAISDLEGLGYQTRAFVFPACAVDAPHQRMRCFIVGHSNNNGQSLTTLAGSTAAPCDDSQKRTATPGQSPRTGGQTDHATLANACNLGRQGRHELQPYPDSRWFNPPSEQTGRPKPGKSVKYREAVPEDSEGWQWSPEPGVGRVADGVPDRVDRIKALGNAVVPRQVYQVLRAIAKIEGEAHEQ